MSEGSPSSEKILPKIENSVWASTGARALRGLGGVLALLLLIVGMSVGASATTAIRKGAQVVAAKTAKKKPKRATRSAGASARLATAESLGSAAPVVTQNLAPITLKNSQSSAVAALTTKPGTPAGQSAAQATNLSGPTAGKKRFGAVVAASFSASARSTADEDRASDTDLELVPWMAVGRHLTLDAYLGLTRPTNGYRETKLADIRLGLARAPTKLSRNWSFRSKGTIFLPTNEDRREIHSFRTGLNLAGRFLFSAGMLQGFYQISGTQNVYRYTTTGTGESNPARSLAHVLKGVLVQGRFYLDVTGSMASRWTFEGAPSTTFDIAEEIGISEGIWSVGIGHTNSDSLYQANGSDSNFTFFDGNSSKYYVSASVVF